MCELDKKLESQKNPIGETRASVEGAYHGKSVSKPEGIFPDLIASEAPTPASVGSQAETTEPEALRAFLVSESIWATDSLANISSDMDIYGNMDEAMQGLAPVSELEQTQDFLPSPPRTAESCSHTPQEDVSHNQSSEIQPPVPVLAENSSSKPRSQNLGKTALHISSERGSLSIVQFLLSSGVDVNKADNRGRTALHYAAHAGRLDIVSQLLIAGAALDARDHEGQSPVHLAADAQREEVIQFLAQRAAK